jgi:hypothetical protein
MSYTDNTVDIMGGSWYYNAAMKCYLTENPGKSETDWSELSLDTKFEYKRPIRVKGEGTPGKFYFRITNPKYQLVEITRENALHHFTMCFESIEDPISISPIPLDQAAAAIESAVIVNNAH